MIFTISKTWENISLRSCFNTHPHGLVFKYPSGDVANANACKIFWELYFVGYIAVGFFLCY